LKHFFMHCVKNRPPSPCPASVFLAESVVNCANLWLPHQVASNRPKSTPNHRNYHSQKSLKLACARLSSHFQETSANGFSQRSGRQETGSAGANSC
jgi:hypothetical protein